MRFLLVLAIFAAPLAAQSVAPAGRAAAGTTYYVSASGNDATGTPGDSSKAFRSPRGAYSRIPANITRGTGDHIILLMDGTRYGQLRMTPRVTDAAHRIILRAADGVAPIMDAFSTVDGSAGSALRNNPVLHIEPSHVVIQGLRFHNTSPDTSLGPSTIGFSEVMVRLDGSNTVIDGNYFDGNGRAPTSTDIFLLICNNASDNVISGNRFDFSGGWTLSTAYSENPWFVDAGASPPDLHVESTGGSRRNGSQQWFIDAHCSVAIDKAPVSDAFDREPAPNGGRRNIGAFGNTTEASRSCRSTSLVLQRRWSIPYSVPRQRLP